MTIPETAQLVIQAGAMGQPVKIAELAEKNMQGDVAIDFSGLRPGYKLYEELLIGDNVSPTGHPMIMSANEEHLPWEQFKVRLSELLDTVERDDYDRVRQLLRETVSGYKPEGEIVDWIHMKRRLES